MLVKLGRQHFFGGANVRPTIVLKRSMTAHQYMRRRGSKDSEKKHVAYGCASYYSVRALRVGHYMNKVHHVAWKSLVRIFSVLNSPKVIRAQTLNFKPNFKFSRSKVFFLGGWASPFGCALSRLGQSLARIKFWAAAPPKGWNVVSPEKYTWLGQC